MEPEHNITSHTIANIFDTFDANGNQRVTLEELVSISKIKILHYHPGHKQIHIGLTEREAEMRVMWVSNPEAYSRPVVQYGHYPTQL